MSLALYRQKRTIYQRHGHIFTWSGCMSAPERDTEQLVRELFAKLGYETAKGIIVDEQSSSNTAISACLKGAAKPVQVSISTCGTKLEVVAPAGKTMGKGSPEFIVSATKFPDLVVVVECKADPKAHQSANLDRPESFAVDGAIHYGRFLAKRFNVIAIGASGRTAKDFKLSAHLISKGSLDAKPLLTRHDAPVQTLEPLEVLQEYAARDPEVEKRRVKDLMTYARDLHNFMRDYAKLSESEKPLLISGILIGLQHRHFREGFEDIEGADLPEALTSAIKTVVSKSKKKAESADLLERKRAAMLHAYSFVTVHTVLSEPMKGSTQTPLQKLVADIAEHVYPFITKVGEDIIGRFYGEFLKYTGGDGKGLGIVLTPGHITELFCDLSALTANDVLLDPCCGTAGFLVAGMHWMLTRTGVTATKCDDIKANQLVGVEQQAGMFALAASNMILRGDGKANLFQGSCFDSDVTNMVVSMKPTVGFINPPYSQKGAGLHEFDFILHMLNCLEKGGRAVAIVPLSCASSDHPLKEQILQTHTLEAVLSLPDKLFQPAASIIPCVMIFRAKESHYDADGVPFKKTWLGLCKDDGFVATKTMGRSDYYGRWPAIKKTWLANKRDRATGPGVGVELAVTGAMEWCAEAYVETDYSRLSRADFEREIKKYMLFQRRRDGAVIDGVDEAVLLEGV